MQSDKVRSIREDQILNGYSDEVIGFQLSYNFLSNGLNDEDPESWVLSFLSKTSEDNSDGSGIEEGRVKLENPYLVLGEFRSFDFIESSLSQNYQSDTGDEKGIGEYYNNNQLGIIFNTLNSIYEDNIWACTNPDRSNTNRYSLEISMEDFDELYESLEHVVFPSDDLVRSETGRPAKEVGIERHVKNFPYANNDYVVSQTDQPKSKIISERQKYVGRLKQKQK